MCDLPGPGIGLASLTLAGRFFTISTTWEALEKKLCKDNNYSKSSAWSNECSIINVTVYFSPFIHSHLNFACFPLSASCIIPLHETIPPSHQLPNILSKKVKCAWWGSWSQMGQSDCPALARFCFSVYQWISVQKSLSAFWITFSGVLSPGPKHMVILRPKICFAKHQSNHLWWLPLPIHVRDTSPQSWALVLWFPMYLMDSEALCHIFQRDDNLVPILESHSVKWKTLQSSNITWSCGPFV